MPFILFGQVVSAVGTGCLTTLSLSTPTPLWATFMALAGWGTGMVENTPYIAIQASIKKYVLLASSTFALPANYLYWDSAVQSS